MAELITEMNNELDEEMRQAFEDDAIRVASRPDDDVTTPSYWSDNNEDQFDWIDEMHETQEHTDATSAETDTEADDDAAPGDDSREHETNNGMFGRGRVKDINYAENEAAPFIVLGVLASVVFILMVLIFVARRMSLQSERLKYRPLNESFSSSAQYHDSRNTNYQDLE